MARRDSAGGALPPSKLAQRRDLASPGHPKGGVRKPGPAADAAKRGSALSHLPDSGAIWLQSLTPAGIPDTVPGHGFYEFTA